MSNPLVQRNSPESICLRAFLLVLQERSLSIASHAVDVYATEEISAVNNAYKEAHKGGIIFPRYIDLMAKVIQGMGYSGEEGHSILTFFRNKASELAKNNT